MSSLAGVTYTVGTGSDTVGARAGDGSQVGTIAAFTVADPPAVVVDSGQTLEVANAYDGSVTFASGTGTLKLDRSSSFSGTVAGLCGEDSLDLTDLDPSRVEPPKFSGDASGGTLSVTDGTLTARIALIGNYMAAAFTATCDGHGGTSVVERPNATAQPVITTPHV